MTIEKDTQMNRGKRKSSFSRGFGINVIDTSHPSIPLNAGSTKTTSPVSPTFNIHETSANEFEGDSSIISQSTIASNTDEKRSLNLGLNIISSLSTLEESRTDTNNSLSNDHTMMVDVSLSTKSMRSSSFNKGSSPNLRRPMSTNQNIVNHNNINNNNQGGNSRRNMDKFQRFRSSPNLNTPTYMNHTDSPPIPLPKSNQSSPYIPQLNRVQSQQPLNHHSRVKLPRPRSVQQLTRKQKDKFYDENDNDAFEEASNDILMYNVPVASSSSIRMFQNGNAMQSRDALRRAWDESESNVIIPPSPLPGRLHEEFETDVSPNIHPNIKSTQNKPSSASSEMNINSSTNPGLKGLSPTAQQLSNFYEYSSHNDVENELLKRKNRAMPSTADPKLAATLDDLSLASAEKLAKLTVTRPSWIPPKDAMELQKHEKEFQRMISHTSKQALKHSKQLAKHEKERKLANDRLINFSQKEKLTSSNCFECRKLLLVANVDNNVKFSIFKKLINYKLGSDVLLVPPFMKGPSSQIDVKQQLPELDIPSMFDRVKTNLSDEEVVLLQDILQPIARPIPSSTVDISKISKIPALPIQTLLSRLAGIALKLLRCHYSPEQVRDMTYWLHAHIFTFKFKEEYSRLLQKATVTKLFKEFKDDYSILTIPTSLDLLLDLSDSVVCKFIELLISYWCIGGGRGAKLVVVASICIIRDYHFGWNNLQVILHSKAHVYIGDGDEKQQRLFDHILHYYALV